MQLVIVKSISPTFTFFLSVCQTGNGDNKSDTRIFNISLFLVFLDCTSLPLLPPPTSHSVLCLPHNYAFTFTPYISHPPRLLYSQPAVLHHQQTPRPSLTHTVYIILTPVSLSLSSHMMHDSHLIHPVTKPHHHSIPSYHPHTSNLM